MTIERETELQENDPVRPRGWRHIRRLCLAIVLSLALFNATVAPTAHAEGTFEAPKIVRTTVLIIAVALTSMLTAFNSVMAPPIGTRSPAHRWFLQELRYTTLTASLILVAMAPILLMTNPRHQVTSVMTLLLAAVITLNQPFSIPPNVAYSN